MSRAVVNYFARMQMPCSEIEKTLIMEAADDFSDQIAIDVKNFILQLICIESMDQSPRKVIVFPEVNDLGELLIDEIVKIFPNLISFVVGPPKSKRIVVCSHAIVKNKVLEDLAAGDTVGSLKKLTSEPETQSEKIEASGTLSPSLGVNCTTRTVGISTTTSTTDDGNNVKKEPIFNNHSSSCEDTTKDDSKLDSFLDESSSVIEPLIDTSVNVNLKSKSVVSSSQDKPKDSNVSARVPGSSTAKVARPDEGTFRRVMTELYIAADRHRPENKVPASSFNNWTRKNVCSVTPQPQLLPSTPQITTPRTSTTTCAPPISEKSSSSSDEDKGIPCLVQPEEDIYWKKLTCAHLNEIYCILGCVEIVKPKWKQISYDMQISLKEHALGHILETYNMNEKIVTRDLSLMFASFKTSGFNIKWVDSTKALVVFSSATKAAEALRVEHPVIKTRPVLIASRESKLRILQCSQYLLPYKDRPKTVATVARRMISNSLGIFPKVEANPEIVEKERNIIEQARAEKLLRGRERTQGTPSSPKTEDDKDEWMKFDI